MDRELPSNIRRKKKLRSALLPISIVIIIMLGFTGFRWLIIPSVEKNRIETAQCIRGDLISSLTVSGHVTAAGERIVIAPYNTEILEIIKEPGDLVEAGDILMRLDKSDLLNEKEALLNEILLLQSSMETTELNNRETLSQIKTSIEIGHITRKSLELEKNKAEVHKNLGLGSELDLQRLTSEYEIKTLELGRLEESYHNIMAIQESNAKELNLRKANLDFRLKKLEERIQASTIKSPVSGVLSWTGHNMGAAIGTGERLAVISDLSQFAVKATIPESQSELLYQGLEVVVQLGQEKTTGRIRSIEPTVSNGVITFTVQLDNDEDLNLRPNRKVSVIIPSELGNEVLMLPRGPALNGQGPKDVYVLRGNEAEKRQIRTGMGNSEFIEITEGLSEGEEVIISKMDRFKAAIIKIKE